MGAGLAIALPAATFVLLAARLDGGWRSATGHLPLALGLSAGVASLGWWALFAAPSIPARARLWIDLVLWLLALAAVFRIRQREAISRPAPPSPRPWTWLALAFFLLVAALAATSFVAASAVLPHGTWDAWAIWNLRARFLSRGLPDVWRDGFSPLLHWSHPDYPLLVPLSVARGWTYAGRETTMVPTLLSALFAISAAGTAAISVARARGTAAGLMTAAAMLASPAFVEHASGQIADIPLGFYMLAAFVLMFNAAAAPGARVWWLLAGAAAGLAAWTKNEGLLFLAVFTGAAGWWSIRTRGMDGLKDVAVLLAGAAPSVAALAVLKWRIAAPDLLVASQSAGHVATHIADTDRFRVAGAALARELWLGGAPRIGVLPILAGYVLAAGVRRPLGVPAVAAAAMMAMLAGYLLVYVLTPYDFAWHLRTSAERVVLQLFPTLVWCAMMAAGPPSATLGTFMAGGSRTMTDRSFG